MRTKLVAGLLAACLLMSGCTAAGHTGAPSPAAPAPVPATTPPPAPKIIVPVQAQQEALLVLQRYFGALAANDFATADSLWSAKTRPFIGKRRADEKSGITGLRSLECHDFQPVQGDPTALGCNMTVDLITADGHAANAWGEGRNSRAVKFVKEEGHWAIDAMASGPPWPMV